MEVTTTWYLVLGAMLFSIGGTGLLIRRNPLVMFMCVELMLNAVNLTFVAFGRSLGDLGGQVSVFFVLVVAAPLRVTPTAKAAMVDATRAMALRPGVVIDDGITAPRRCRPISTGCSAGRASA